MSNAEWIPVWEDSGAKGGKGHQTEGKNYYKVYTLNIYNVYMSVMPQESC